jgi:hypothetical protein
VRLGNMVWGGGRKHPITMLSKLFLTTQDQFVGLSYAGAPILWPPTFQGNCVLCRQASSFLYLLVNHSILINTLAPSIIFLFNQACQKILHGGLSFTLGILQETSGFITCYHLLERVQIIISGMI